MAQDQTTTQPSLTIEEARKIIFLARQVGSEKTFDIFQKELKDEKIPWSFIDERFLIKVVKLRETLIDELRLQNGASANHVAEETFSHALSNDEREGMARGFDRIKEQEELCRRDLFESKETLVNSYIKNLKEKVALSSEQESLVRNSVFQAVQQTINRGSLVDVKKQIEIAATAYIPSEVATSTAASIEIPRGAQESLDKIPQLSKITETALGRDDIDGGIFIERCLENPAVDPEIVASKNKGELQTEKMFSLSPDIKQEIDKTLDKTLDSAVDRKTAFIQAVESGRKGISQPLDDVFTAVGGPQGKRLLDDVAATILGTSLKEITTSGSIAGKTLKSNDWTGQKLQHVDELLKQKGAASRASKIFFDRALVASAEDVLTPQVQEGLRIYLETATIKVSAIAPEYFHYFILSGTDIWNTIIGRSTKQVAFTTAKKTAFAAGKKVIMEGGKEATKKGLFSAVSGALRGGVGLIASQAVSFIWGGITGFFSAISGFFTGIVRPQQPGPKTWTGDHGLVLGIICAGAILFCAGMTLTRELTTTAAIVAEKGGSEGGTGVVEGQNTGRGYPHGDPGSDVSWGDAVTQASAQQRRGETPVDYCAQHPDAPACQPLSNPDAKWPVVSSNPSVDPYVSQGPGGSWSHAGSIANSVDIAAPIQSQILSPVGGIVSAKPNEYVNKYADGSGYAGSSDGGGYGNYIVIQTTDGNMLIVGHLAYNSMPAPGTQITVGQQIGRIGQTGNSTGPHVHFGYTNSNAPSINTLFPTKIPVGCSSSASCGYINASN